MTSERGAPITVRKRARLVLGALTVWLLLLGVVLSDWLFNLVPYEPTLARLSFFSAAVWWLALLWAIHHLAFQVSAVIMPDPASAPPRPGGTPSVAILYVTRDDLVESALLSCLSQNYPNYHVYICDDSTQKDKIGRIRAIARRSSGLCTHIRRPIQSGFKAGNLNYAIKEHVREEWLCLADADQYLPSTFVSDAISALPADVDRVAYLQARNEARTTDDATTFQRMMGTEIALYYSRDLPSRAAFGFLPLLGHGAFVHRPVLEILGGFPEIVSEDFALALLATGQGFHGQYAAGAVSQEEYPRDFGAFVIRIKKFSSGTAQLLGSGYLRFLGSRAHLVEKWDFSVMVLWYLLVPFILVNGFVGAYVTHRYWEDQIPYIQPLLPYLFTFLLMVVFSVLLSIEDLSVGEAIRFYFWATAIYSSAFPVMTLGLVQGMLGGARFTPTPKSTRQTAVGRLDTSLTMSLGVAAATASVVWTSPFSLYLLGQGTSYLLFPLLAHLNQHSILSRATRSVLIYVPGTLMIGALFSIWLAVR